MYINRALSYIGENNKNMQYFFKNHHQILLYTDWQLTQFLETHHSDLKETGVETTNSILNIYEIHL